MEKNDFIMIGEYVYRILTLTSDKILVINCQKKEMPVWVPNTNYSVPESSPLTELPAAESLTAGESKVMYERYTVISSILAVSGEKAKRSKEITRSAELYGISKQSVRNYLCSYLVYQDIVILAPKYAHAEKELTPDQKNIRWALNRFFYTQNKNPLKTAYAMMLKERYCDQEGTLVSVYPSFYQFRYYYRKHRVTENYLISRNGLRDYQRNDRPLLGDGVQSFAPNIGTAMLDGTTCDIYLVDDAGQLVGRPILLAAVDANTSLCIGYALLWEGGIYSVVQLMLNIITDKVELCKRLGIEITREQWDVTELPGVMVTDRGSEYIGQTFEQISELGVTIINLPSYRAELKGPVEKLFSLVQDSFKAGLKGKGVIMPDWQTRGSHDYRKDACLTMREFERIVVKCIVYYNSHRVVENYPYSKEMLDEHIKPYANSLWNYKKAEAGANLIRVSPENLSLVLLPRTEGKFTRFGLKVNKLRYHAEGYKEQYLTGGDAVVAYSPDNCSRVWLREKDGRFVEFKLIESRFQDMPLEEVQAVQEKQQTIVQSESEENLKAKIELMNFIESVSCKEKKIVQIQGVRKTRSSQKRKQHKEWGEAIDE